MPQTTVKNGKYFEDKADKETEKAETATSEVKIVILKKAIGHYNRAIQNHPLSHDNLQILLSILLCYENIIEASDDLSIKRKYATRREYAQRIIDLVSNINLSSLKDKYDHYDVHVSLFKAYKILGEFSKVYDLATEIVNEYSTLVELKSKVLKKDKKKYEKEYDINYFDKYEKDYQIALKYKTESDSIDSETNVTEKKREMKKVGKTGNKRKRSMMVSADSQSSYVDPLGRGEYKHQNVADLPGEHDTSTQFDAVEVKEPWLEEFASSSTIKCKFFYKPALSRTISLAYEESDVNIKKKLSQKDLNKIEKIKEEELENFKNNKLISVITKDEITGRKVHGIGKSFKLPIKSKDETLAKHTQDDFVKALHQYNAKNYFNALSSLYSLHAICVTLIQSDAANKDIHHNNAILIAVYIDYLISIICEDQRKLLSVNNSDKVDPVVTLLVEDFQYLQSQDNKRKIIPVNQPSPSEHSYAQKILPEALHTLGHPFSESLRQPKSEQEIIQANPFDLHHQISARIFTEVLRKEQRELHASNVSKLKGLFSPVKKETTTNKTSQKKKASNEKVFFAAENKKVKISTQKSVPPIKPKNQF